MPDNANTGYKVDTEKYKEAGGSSPRLFNNLPDLVKPHVVSELLGVSIKTIYDWNYRQQTRNIPNDLFIKVNRLLYLRTDVLRRWITSQNPFMG